MACPIAVVAVDDDDLLTVVARWVGAPPLPRRRNPLGRTGHQRFRRHVFPLAGHAHCVLLGSRRFVLVNQTDHVVLPLDRIPMTFVGNLPKHVSKSPTVSMTLRT